MQARLILEGVMKVTRRGIKRDQKGQVLHRNILCFWGYVLHERPLDLLAATGLDSVLQCKT